jgi:hypothetical protein
MLLSAGRFPLSTIVIAIAIFIFLLLTFESIDRVGAKQPVEDPLNDSVVQNEADSSNVGGEAIKGYKARKTVELEEYMSDMLKWNRPDDRDGQWPRYSDFEDRDYDPNRWEGFSP